MFIIISARREVKSRSMDTRQKTQFTPSAQGRAKAQKSRCAARIFARGFAKMRPAQALPNPLDEAKTASGKAKRIPPERTEDQLEGRTADLHP